MGLNYFASAPTLVLPPQNLSHPLMHHATDQAGTGADCTAQTSEAAKRFIAKIPCPPSMNYLVKSDNSAAGRKRSRADIGEDLDDEFGATATARLEKGGDMLMGIGDDVPLTESNVLSEQSSERSREGPQNGATNCSSAKERPRLVARKSQRIEEADCTPAHPQAEIDPVIRRLGIGWKVVRDSQSPAVAGQQAYIRNQFAFQDPRIVLQHEGMGILVVQSKPANAQGYWDQWWLFTDDLRSCRFLCHDENELFRRLSNKRQDERGIWQPEILVEGPVIQAREAVQAAVMTTESPVRASDQPDPNAPSVASAQADVDMYM